MNYAYRYTLLSMDGKQKYSATYITSAKTVEQARINLEKRFGEKRILTVEKK